MRYIVSRVSLIIKEFERLELLLKLWSHMAHMLSEDFEPSYYLVFRNILNEWIAKRNASNLSRLVSDVRSELDGLSTSVALSTGMSMSIIWERCHVIVPSSLGHWKVFEKLITLINEFENKVAFQIGMRILFLN